MADMPTLPGPLVTADWLAKNAPANHAIRVVDASWYLPTQKRDPRAEYEAEHIPGAVFFDIDAISDTTCDLPHMLPSEENFDAAVGSLGIANHHAVVVYDGAGVFSSPRAWWMFRTFGHDNVAVLQGGLPAWKAAGNRTDNEVPAVSRQLFSSRFDGSLVRDSKAVLANIDTQIAQVVDARSAGRFEGRDPEPRAGLKSGHIPGSINLPYGDLLNPTSLHARPGPDQSPTGRCRHQFGCANHNYMWLRHFSGVAGTSLLYIGSHGNRCVRRVMDRMGRHARRANRLNSLA